MPHFTAGLENNEFCMWITSAPLSAEEASKALGDVAPADVLYGRREQILQRRRKVKAQTIQNRRHYNQTLRELKHTS